MAESESTNTEQQLDATPETIDRLMSFQADGEDLEETLERLMLAFPHAAEFNRNNIDAEQLDSDTRFVMERWPDEDGYVDSWVFNGKMEYINANASVARRVE
ncbi:MAG: hypothetical protein ABEI52_12415 [Halobacteriaceae archaeon]